MHGRNSTQVVVWVVGLALVIVALFMLFVETGLSRMVPFSLAVAGMLLIVGVAVMGMADRTRGPDYDSHVDHRETEIVERRIEDPHSPRHHH